MKTPFDTTQLVWEKPAARAGDSGSFGRHTEAAALAGCTQSDTCETVRVGFETPSSMNTEPSMMTARKTFIIGPPDITMTFFHHSFL